MPEAAQVGHEAGRLLTHCAPQRRTGTSHTAERRHALRELPALDRACWPRRELAACRHKRCSSSLDIGALRSDMRKGSQRRPSTVSRVDASPPSIASVLPNPSMSASTRGRSTLHGFVPDASQTAILLLDLITDFDFPDGRRLRSPARVAAQHIRLLVDRATRRKIPVIYVNDNMGRWRSDAPSILGRCQREESLGKEIARTLAPQRPHYFVLKPKHSAFFGTPLDLLLKHIGASTLVITGLSSHQCVLFTATDAYVRDYRLVIPRDCVAAPTPAQTRFALRYFRNVLGADTRASSRLVLRR